MADEDRPMHGTKDKQIKVEDSNVANVGSDMDKKARVAAAETEPAWAEAGKKPGFQVWRIEKFQVKKSKTPIGTFYAGDSYICLNTYQVKDEDGNLTDKLGWDIHFWLGKNTSQDEQGTAAYKTVELDDLLGGEPVQHREVMGHESNMFTKYFEQLGGMRILDGGVDSGFNHVTPEKYKPRLLHLKGRKNIRITEIPIDISNLYNDDVFILDAGMFLYQWQGTNAGKNEKARAGQLARAIDDERKGLPEVFVYCQGDKDEYEFFQHFPGDWTKGNVPNITVSGGDDAEWEKSSMKKLFRLSDESGKLTFSLVAEKIVKRSMLDSKDVFIFDIGCEVFVWLGKKSSPNEKKHAMENAQKYIKDHKRPDWLPVTRLIDGGENEVFESSFDWESAALKSLPKSGGNLLHY